MFRRVSCIIHGIVQGVTYRDSTARAARRLGLVGFVHNLADGTVEIVAEGGEHVLKEFLGTLRSNNPWATVERIDAVWSTATGEFSDFRILLS